MHQADEKQRSGGVGGERVALPERLVRPVGPAHPVDDPGHREGCGQHREVVGDRDAKRARLGQPHRIARADLPPGSGGPDVAGDGGDQREKGGVGEERTRHAVAPVVDRRPLGLRVGKQSECVDRRHSNRLPGVIRYRSPVCAFSPLISPIPGCGSGAAGISAPSLRESVGYAVKPISDRAPRELIDDKSAGGARHAALLPRVSRVIARRFESMCLHGAREPNRLGG